jgi:hypothetical protein
MVSCWFLLGFRLLDFWQRVCCQKGLLALPKDFGGCRKTGDKSLSATAFGDERRAQSDLESNWRAALRSDGWRVVA